MTPQAIVFDLDDTLYLERDYVRSGFCAAGNWFGVAFGKPDFAERAQAAFIAGKRGNIFDSVLGSFGIVPEPALVDRLVAIYRDHAPSITLCEDARSVLDSLCGTCPLAIITDGPSSTQRRKIYALGIAPLFDIVLVTGELGAENAKPHPLAFRMVEERLGLRERQLVYIGDNPQKDFEAPRRRDWQTIQVRRKEGIYADAAGCYTADHLIDDLRELLPILEIKTPDQLTLASLLNPRR
jgi:putative hydrolase of the HAD superfamily